MSDFNISDFPDLPDADKPETTRWRCPSCQRMFRLPKSKSPPKMCGKCKHDIQQQTDDRKAAQNLPNQKRPTAQSKTPPVLLVQSDFDGASQSHGAVVQSPPPLPSFDVRLMQQWRGLSENVRFAVIGVTAMAMFLVVGVATYESPDVVKQRRRHEQEMERLENDRKEREVARLDREIEEQKIKEQKIEEQKIEESKTNNRVGAWVMAKTFVERQLKSPGTADYGGWFEQGSDQVKSLGNYKYAVHGWVDAQNSFGGVVRTHFNMTLRDNGDGTWSDITKEIEEQKIEDPARKPSVLERLSVEERKQIAHECKKAMDEAQRDVVWQQLERQIEAIMNSGDLDDSDVKAAGRLQQHQQRIDDQHLNVVADRHGLTLEDVAVIYVQGQLKGWISP